MIQRILVVLLLLVLAACGSSPSPEATAEAANDVVTEASTEAVAEATSYSFEPTTTHSTPLNWSGTATFSYPAAWTLRDTSTNGLRGEITLFGPDNYSFSISFNNDPANTTSSLENILNMLNQTASIETVERDGRTLFYTPTRGGNGLAAAIYVDGNSYALIEIVNSARGELEPILETAFSLLLSVTITAGE